MKNLSSLALVLALSSPLTAGLSSDREFPPTPTKDVLSEAVNASLELTSSVLLDVAMVGEVGQRTTALLKVNGSTYQVNLRPHSVRGPNYRVRAQREDGSWYQVDPGPVRTLRGTVVGIPGSVVAGAWTAEGGLEARFRFASGEDWWLQPVAKAVPGMAPSAHAFYASSAATATGKCGVIRLSNPLVEPGYDGGSGSGGASGGGSASGSVGTLTSGVITDLATDADYEYFLAWGSVSGVQQRIESVINTVNLLYEFDVAIQHQIGTQLIRTSSGAPYRAKNASKLLGQMKTEWTTNQTGVSRDVAHLFTGKQLGGDTIGYAYIGVVCNPEFGYGLAESDWSTSFAKTTDLTSHELGHNWNADHCTCTNFTMNAIIRGNNNFNPVGTIPTINFFRDAATCIGAPPTPTTVRIQAISTSLINVGQGQKKGTTTVSIADNAGNPAVGYTVAGDFTGSLIESFAGVTDQFGNVTFTTTGSTNGSVSVTFCVSNVSGGTLPYDPSSNVVFCGSN